LATRLLAWGNEPDARVLASCRSSARARVYGVLYRVAGLCGLLAIGYLLWLNQSSQQKTRASEELRERVAHLQEALTDDQALRSWCALSERQRSEASAKRAADEYWKRSLFDTLRQAKLHEDAGCFEDALVIATHAAQRGAKESDVLAAAKQSLRMFGHAAGTVWLPNATKPFRAEEMACSVSTAATCQQLRYAENGDLVGLCSEKLHRWPASLGAVVETGDAARQTLLALAGDFVVTSDGGRVSVRRGMSGAARSFAIGGCAKIESLAARKLQDHLLLAVACDGIVAKRLEVAAPAKWLEGLRDGSTLSLSSTTLADRNINRVAWLDDKLVLATDRGLNIGGQWVGDRESQVIALAATADHARVAYGTVQSEQERAARLGSVSVEARGRLRESSSSLPLLPGKYWVEQVSVTNEGVVALTQSMTESLRARVVLPQLSQVVLEAPATAIAAGQIAGALSTVVSLPGRLRILTRKSETSTDAPSPPIDFARAQAVTGLSFNGQTVQLGPAQPARDRQQVFPSRCQLPMK
jgi:hypothetical protein